MIKYACYARVSTDKEEQASSLDNQKMLFDNYIKNNIGELYKVYEDIETGTNSNRNGLNQLINDAKNKKFSVILIKEWSRLSRNAYYSFFLKNLFEELNIKVINVSTGNNALEENIMLFAVNSAHAQSESENTSRRTKQSFIAKSYRGEFKGSRPPYGYKKVDTKLIIRDDDTPNIVRSIFEMYLNGFGSDKIAKYLNKNNVPTPSQVVNWKNAGNLWNGSAIDKIIRNRVYIGDLVQHKTTTVSVVSNKRYILSPDEYIIKEGIYEPIISKELFYKVQEMIKLRHKERRKSQVHLFSNILYCSDCNKRLHYKANRKGYVCAGYNRHGKDVCSSHLIKEEDLEKVILADLKNILSKINNKKIVNKLKEQISLKHNTLDSDIKKINNKLQDLNEKKVNASMMLVSKELPLEQYNIVCSKIDKEIKELEDTKVNLSKSSSDDFMYNVLNELDRISKDISEIVTLNHKVLSQLISKIEINENGEPRIFYKFSAQIDYIDKLLLN